MPKYAATAVKLDVDFDDCEAAPALDTVQKSYRARRQTRRVEVTEKSTNLFADQGTTLATEILELEPQNAFT